MHATLTILHRADEYHFLWTTTHVSPARLSSTGDASLAPICLSGITAIDGQRVQMLQHHINAAAAALNLAQAGAEIAPQSAASAAANSFETLGRLLFSQLIPTQIQQQLHALPAGSTLQIIATEINLPWELLHDGRNLLALQHSLSRLPMLPQPQHQHQPRQRTPKVSCLLLGNPNRDLPVAEKEISAIEEILYTARDRVRYRSLYGGQITRIHLQELLASQQYDLIHFAGHARPGALRLADGWFSAEEIVAALHNHPLIVLNACASAQSAPEATDLTTVAQKAESLAGAFIQGGAAAVIGMLWPVPDAMMVQLGEELYRHLVAGQGIGEALRLSRVAIQQRDRSGIAWLAPVLYGNPYHQAMPMRLKETAGTLLSLRFHGAMADYQQVREPRPQDLQHYLALLCQRIVHHGGTLYHADAAGLLAAFGVDHAIDSDAVQAISAARDLRAIAATWQAPPPTAVITSGELATTLPEPNTGQNPVSQLTLSAPFLFGQPLTDSQLMLARATPGQILVNHLAQERGKDRFHFRQWADGVSSTAAGATYELISSPLDMPVERLTLDFTIAVGREREQARLAEAWREVMDRHGQVIGISGEAGIGKSHLVNTFKRTIAPDNARWQQVICTTDVQYTSYGLLARLLRAFLELPDYATNAQIDAVLRACFPDQLQPAPPSTLPSALTVSQPDRALLADLLGSQPQHLRLQEQAVYQHQLYALLRRLLGQQLRQGPLVLVVEDAHWSDPASMDVLTLLATNMGDAPVLLLLLYRSEWTPPWHGKDYFQNINLKQLDPKSRQTLFRSMLNSAQLPEELVALIERSSGNPLFLTEILVSLVQKGLLVAQDDSSSPRWRLHGILEPSELPDTVQRIIEMRLDQLDAQVRTVLEIAAVVGTSFTPAMLLWGGAIAENVLFDYLKTLVEHDFLRHIWESDSYEFRHALIRDVVYTKIAVAQRQRWHKQIADRLERREHHQREAVAELAHHYYLSLLDSHQPDASILNREADSALVEKAFAYLLRSGQDALDRYGGREAVTLFQRGSVVAELLTRDAVRQANIYTGLGNSYRLLNSFEQAAHAFEEAHAALHRQPLTLETRPQAAHLARLLARQNMRWAKYEVAEAWIETGLERVRAFTDAGCQSATAMLYIHAGSVCYNRGALQRAIEYCQTGLQIALACENEEAQAEGTIILGAIMQTSSRYDESLDYYKRSLAIHEQRQNLYQIHRVEGNIGVVYYSKGDWPGALSYFEKTSKFWQAIDNLDLLAIALLNTGLVKLCQGDWAAAQEAYLQALAIWKEMQSQRWLARCYSNLGGLYSEQELWDQAADYLALSQQLIDDHKIEDLRPDVLCGRALVALAKNQLDAALPLVQQAEGIAKSQGQRLDEAIALRVQGQVLCAKLDFTQALRLLEQSRLILNQLGEHYEKARTIYQLALVNEGQNDISEAKRLCDEALAAFGWLGAQWDLQKAKKLYERLKEKG